jgi:hypothetical protein
MTIRRPRGLRRSTPAVVALVADTNLRHLQRMVRFILAALALIATPAHAQSFSADYEGSAYGVVALGKARLTVTTGDGRYDATGSMRTVGLAVLFGKAIIAATSAGGLADGATRPTLYTLDHDYLDMRRLLRLDWSTPEVSVAWDPPRPYTGEIPTSEAQRRAGRDPLGTLLTMGAHVAATGQCAGVFRVFDGVYVYDFIMRAGKGAGRYRHGDIDLPVLRCTLQQKRIAGYTLRSDLAKELPVADIWFAILPGEPVALLTRFSTSLPLGAATISLTRLQRS